MANFLSKLGLKAIFSTKDPNGNPPTLGEPFAQIFRDNMQLIETNLLIKADGAYVKDGKLQLTSYGKDIGQPITFPVSNPSFLNISLMTKKYDFADQLSARKEVPEQLRTRGQIITYQLKQLNEGDKPIWREEQFIGPSLEGWLKAEYWIDKNPARVFDGGRPDSVYGGTRHIDGGTPSSVFDGSHINCGGPKK